MWDEVFVVLPVTGYSFPVTVNILSFTGKVYCDTRCSFLFLSQEINFLSQEILFISQHYYICNNFRWLCWVCDLSILIKVLWWHEERLRLQPPGEEGEETADSNCCDLFDREKEITASKPNHLCSGWYIRTWYCLVKWRIWMCWWSARHQDRSLNKRPLIA